MPIYSPTGFLDITNATLRTSNLEAQNFKLNGGNIYVTSELTTDELLNLDNVVNAGNATSNTVQFTNLTTGLVADSNIVVTGNVTAGSFLGDGSGLTSIPPSAITGTLSQWSDGTNSDVYIASNVGIGNVHTLTSNTLQVGANLYVRDADANVLTVTGNVAADYFEGDGSKLTGISSTLQAITDSGNVTSNTVQFTNATTGFVTTSNIEVGGALKINTITAAAYHSLQAVTNVGNVTSNTVQFSNATTGLVTTGNVEVGRDLSVTGNLTVLGTRTIVDTDTLRVKDPIIELGKDNPGTGDLGLVMTRLSGSSNVAMIFDESTDTLEIGYTQSNASDTDITMRTAAIEPLDVNVNGNVSVGKELTVAGNVAVDTDTLFVDSVNNRVGVGTTSPGARLHVYDGTGTVASEMILGPSAAADTAGVVKYFHGDGSGTGYMIMGNWGDSMSAGTGLVVKKGGNVGIGTTNPLSVLHVHGSSANQSNAPDTSSSTAGLIVLRNTKTGSSPYSMSLGVDQATGIGYLNAAGNSTNQPICLNTRGGNVGIGTIDPAYSFDVQTSSDASDKTMTRLYSAANATGVSSTGLILEKGTGYGGVIKGFISQGIGSGLSLHTLNSGTEAQAMTIMNSGNVGIGTSNPKSNFHVGVENASLRIGAVNYSGSAANTSTYGLERSRNQILFSTWRDAQTDKIGAKICGINKQTYSSPTVRHLIQSTDLAFYTVPPSAGNYDDTLERLRITDTGNVGIGTTSPDDKLHLYGATDSTLRVETDTGQAQLLLRSGASTRRACRIDFSRADTGTQYMQLIGDYQQNGTDDLTVATSTSGRIMTWLQNGNVGIGTTSPDSKLQIKPNHTSYSNPGATSGVVVYNETNSDASITHAILNLRTGGSSGGDPFISYDVYGEHGWSVGIDNSAGRQLRFGESWSNFSSTRAYISPGSTANEIDFTGQHRSFIDTIAHTDYLKYEGLIVSANKNQYFDIQEEVVTGVQAIKINESLPLVSISNVAYDKCCFGVISGSEDTNDREYSQGSFVSVLKKQDGDIRAHVNSVGEGAIWVVNTNGILESGDYITTSNVAGYGQKQDSEFLANYTVAKITMDCDFNPSTQPTRIIKRELRDVNYWVKYTYDDISEEEYTRVTNLGRRVRIIESGTEISQEEYENHLKKEGYTETESNTYIRNDTTHQRVFSDKKMEPTDGFNLEVRNEPVNVLDEHGQFQWEDHPTETEKAYKIRHLDANGVITDEANAVHKAAFVGCTYHCG